MIRREVGATLLAESTDGLVQIPIAVGLSYDQEDPWAVTAVFYTPEPVEWIISRDVLWSGMTAPTGGGDVRVSPDIDGYVRLDVRSPHGEAGFRIAKPVVKSFLDRSFEAVPQGSEVADWDLGLMVLLGDDYWGGEDGDGDDSPA